VIVECLTDNRNRTAPDVRSLFKNGQFGTKVGFLFEHVGIVEATHETADSTSTARRSRPGAQNVEPLENVKEDQSGARFFTDRTDLDSVTAALRTAGWTVTTSELGYVAKETWSCRLRTARRSRTSWKHSTTTTTCTASTRR